MDVKQSKERETVTRRRYVGRVVSNAMRTFEQRYSGTLSDSRLCVVNWALSTPDSQVAFNDLEEAMARYAEGATDTLDEVTKHYQKWAACHKVWI
jgi:hypothetical protein